MEKSIQLAGLIGPVLIALSISEALNLHIWAKVPPTVTYLNGLLLFIAGLAVMRAHNYWVANWSVLITLIAWLTLLAGLYRMFAPEAQQLDKSPATYGVIGLLLLIGIVLSIKGYFS
ncbi:MAG: hypothetical protein AAGE93_24330 [Bacteroidota bacterium]